MIAEEIAFAIRNANVCDEKQTLATEIQRILEFQTKLIKLPTMASLLMIVTVKLSFLMKAPKGSWAIEAMR